MALTLWRQGRFFFFPITRAKRNKGINQHFTGELKETMRVFVYLFIHFISKAFKCSVFTVKNSPWDKSQCGWDITRLWQSGVPFPLNAEGGTMEGCVQLNRTSTGFISMLVAEHHCRSHSFLSPNPHAPLSTTAPHPLPLQVAGDARKAD